MNSANRNASQLLKLSFYKKVEISKEYIKDWYEHYNGNVFVSFSGGKDSTVLLHLCRQVYPDIPAIYLDNGLEYPEIDAFAKATPRVICLRPVMSYEQVSKELGYSVLSKHISKAVETYQQSEKKENDLNELKNKIGDQYTYLKDIPCRVSVQCCKILKEEPLNRYISQSGRKTIAGVLAEESIGRMRRFILNGVNQYNKDISYPIIFWREKDVKQYLKEYHVDYCNIYGDLETYGEKRTICMYCLLGIHLEESPNRFERMKKNYPDKYNYFMNTLGMSEIYHFLTSRGL